MSVIFLAICCCMAGAVSADVNETPIVGIVAQELDPSMQKSYPVFNSYIAASYVKAVESSGARVVPIPINKNESYYR